jgi:hypothetical protein
MLLSLALTTVSGLLTRAVAWLRGWGLVSLSLLLTPALGLLMALPTQPLAIALKLSLLLLELLLLSLPALLVLLLMIPQLLLLKLQMEPLLLSPAL